MVAGTKDQYSDQLKVRLRVQKHEVQQAVQNHGTGVERERGMSQLCQPEFSLVSMSHMGLLGLQPGHSTRYLGSSFLTVFWLT